MAMLVLLPDVRADHHEFVSVQCGTSTDACSSAFSPDLRSLSIEVLSAPALEM